MSEREVITHFYLKRCLGIWDAVIASYYHQRSQVELPYTHGKRGGHSHQHELNWKHTHIHLCSHTHTQNVISHLKLLSLVERELCLFVLLKPHASMVGVTHHGPSVSVSVEAKAHMQGEVIVTVAQVDDKTTVREEESTQTQRRDKEHPLTYRERESGLIITQKQFIAIIYFSVVV